MKKIIHFFNINAAPNKVFWALTTKEGLADWWSTDVRVQTGEGGVINFRFMGDFNPDMEISGIEKDQKVEWKCISGHDNWQDNTFSFELRASDAATDLMFVQVYAQELDDEVYGRYNFNWGYYLGSLKRLCETGTGTPFEAS